MSITRHLVDERGERVVGVGDDGDIRKSRPDHYTRRNATGQVFHTYVDPDLWPGAAAADEAQWQVDRQRDAST